ncbi:MAG: adenylate/guanylate cyclase domain-containing protein [Polyangiaceae bacterium]|jgi:class 3 adenylate cyclase|nr:adenylate/guanylate cyclase domain-containing protein [Polyangiaceae bacterium]
MRGHDQGELRALFDLLRSLDALVEQALRERRSLARTMELVLPALAERLGALGVCVRTYDEDLRLRSFSHPAGFAHPAIDEFLRENEEHHDLRVCGRTGVGPFVVAQGLDVAGAWFGSAVALFTPEAERREGFLADALDVACEEIDNFLQSIRTAREKQRVTMALAEALRHPVLVEGLAEAAAVLEAAMSLDTLVLAVLADESPDAPVHTQVYRRGELALDTLGRPGDDAALWQKRARAYLRDDDRELLEALGLESAREEVLIHGIRNATVVGKLVAERRGGDFDTYDRDLLASFANFIRQRVVDFSREYRSLSRSFRPEHVRRLLGGDDYARRHLEPREESAAILYADLSGFTRVCERVLRDPAAIGRLINAWGASAVGLIWAEGGVFDKMVGDCVIGLFGPPFFDVTPAAAVASALRTAWAIRDMTRILPSREGLGELAGEGLGVSAGVHYAPLLVGRFGPNDNYTGFSAGMNNAARLQAQAARDEILVLADAVAALPPDSPFRFGEAREATVKNVSLPLSFRPLVALE